MKIYIPGLAVINASEVTISDAVAVQPPVEPPPVITPPPVVTPPPGNWHTPVDPIVVQWPASGQVQLRTSNFQPGQTIVYRLVWAAGQDPNKFGSVTVVEAPGSAVMPHYLQGFVNGIRKFNGAPNDTGPQFSLCTFPSNAGSIQMRAGETLDVWITNGENNGGQLSNILIDFRLPNRY